ncbi:MAG: HIT domain-containing protein [Proteobacteria bacterium]|nr:HIT domain-containing protein [Pseudomonadota bacterium]
MSLHGAYDDNNIFAKILRGEAPSVKAFEDDVALAFLDLFPQSRGHTLVVPKGQKVKNLLEMEEAAVGPYVQRVQRVAKAVARALKPDGVVVAHYNGAPGGQTIFYPHFHIIPRYEGVPLAGHSHQKRAEIAELEKIATSIAAAIDR